jgi:hypothetical protein
VLLEAHGKLPVRPAKPKREKKAKETAAADKAAAKSAAAVRQRDDLTTRVDPPQSSSYRPAANGSAPQKTPLPNANRGIPTTSTPAGKSTGGPTSSSPQFVGGYGDDEDDRGSPSRKLSRAERKRLRREQRAGQYGDDE